MNKRTLALLILGMSLLFCKCSICDEPVSDSNGAIIIDSGECGNGISWTFDEEGLLEISGEGYMTKNPWRDPYKYDIKKIVIHHGVKNIIDSAFDYCIHLKNVSIPDSVTTIGRWAFQYCDFESVILPNSVISIGEQAFRCCYSLKSVVLPDNLTSIENSTFGLCNKLENITLPYGLTNIGQFAFADCSKLASITIPESVTAIGWGAFWSCTSLSSITIPGSVSVISNNAFNNCPNLTEAVISEGVTQINGNAFEGCSSLHDIVIPGSVVSIGGGAFKNCYELESITILGNIGTIWDETFMNCYSLSCVTVPICHTEVIQLFQDNGYEEILCIGPHAAIVKDPAVEPDEINKGLSEGSHCSICNVAVVEQREIPALNDMSVIRLPSSLISIDDEAFYDLDCQAVIIPDGCTSIGNKAFAYCNKLVYVKIPSSVSSIADDAFKGSDNATVFREEIQ